MAIYDEAVSETITIAPEDTVGRGFDFTVTNDISVTESMTEQFVWEVSISAGIDFAETLTPEAVMNVQVSDTVQFTMTLPDSSEQYDGWVVNASTFAPSRYEGYGFNSFAKVENRYLGAKYNGIFELTGDDDAGVDIDASILLGKEDFGTDKLKAMPNAVLGIATDGDMYLRVIHENAPSYTYKVKVSGSAMRNARVDIGRNMALRYWQLEVYNANGADFELESMKLYPVVLTRRTTER